MEWKSRRRRRAPKEEEFNRDGRWQRDFAARTEPWPIIEHWASEQGYHLIAAKANRRVYQKEGFAALTHTLVDIKVNERHVNLTVGIPVSTPMRLFSLFLYPRELMVNPDGYVGAKRRREVCHELNVLLDRFGRHPILGSQGFRVIDLDSTSLALTGAFLLPFFLFVIATAFRLDVAPGLSQELLTAMGQRLGILAAVAVSLLGLHHLYVIKRFPELAFRAAGAALSLVVFSVLTLWFATSTRTEMVGQKFSYHCFQRYSDTDCRKVLDTLSPREREVVRTRLLLIEKSLTIK